MLLPKSRPLHFIVTILFFMLVSCTMNPPTENASPVAPPANNFGAYNFAALTKNLARYENAIQRPWPMVTHTSVLKLNHSYIDASKLRQHLIITGDLASTTDLENPLVDNELLNAVKLYQQRNGLKADGVINENTIHELNISPTQRLRQLEINLHRWYVLSRELPARFILVNIPAYTLYLYDNKKELLTMKVVIGRMSRPTPEIASHISRIVFNPYWNVPNLIAQKDIVQHVLDDPNYLTDVQMKIYDRQAPDAKEIDANTIDWQKAKSDGFQYHFRQEPGVKNALGLVKFEFQNEDSIYLHDTPSKNLFSLDKRALSSGCVRLEQPFDLVTYLLAAQPDKDANWIKETLAVGKTSYVKVAQPMPIYLTYVTAWVDAAGIVNFRDDLYGKDN
jgi:murein L,D-transpeptidase YcbB/YkuD